MAYYVTGFTCGAFDLLHAGHADMLRRCAEKCDKLIVGLHSDPSLEHYGKFKPVQSLFERYTQLKAIKRVDLIIPYDTELDLVNILRMHEVDVRFLGSDYKDRPYTGKGMPKPEIVFIDRNHTYSSSELRQRVKLAC